MTTNTDDYNLFEAIAAHNQLRNSFIDQTFSKVDDLKKDFFRVIHFKGYLFLLTLNGDGIVSDLNVVVTAVTDKYEQIQISEKSDPKLLVAYGEIVSYLESGKIPDKHVEETDRCIKVLSNRHFDVEEVAYDKS